MTADEFKRHIQIAVANAHDILRPQGSIYLTFIEEYKMPPEYKDAMAYTENIAMKGRARIVVKLPRPDELAKLKNNASIRAQAHDIAFHEMLHVLMSPIIEASIDDTKMSKDSYNLLSERPAYLIGLLAGYAFQRLPKVEDERVYPITDPDFPWEE